jgi:hypothetical protein
MPVIQNIALNLKNSRIYKELPIVGAGYGDPEFQFQGTDLTFLAPYFDEADSHEKILFVKFFYVADFLMLNYETHPYIDIEQTDIIFETDEFEFRNTKIKNFYFVFSSLESTFFVSAEHCEITIELKSIS